MDTAKDMFTVYSKTSTIDLIRNKNKKQAELFKLKHITSYWAKKEKARLQHMINQIDAVIEARKLQMPLF